jgi:hypothetical protein
VQARDAPGTRLKPGTRGVDASGMTAQRRFRRSRALFALLVLAALALPASASAIDVEIVNESGRPAGEVWITPAVPKAVAEVSGFSVKNGGVAMTNDTPVKLEDIVGGTLEANNMISGRLYVAYGKKGVEEEEKVADKWAIKTRFDWVELTTGGVANLTAVDQFGIGMRLESLNGSEHLGTIGTANADTVFNALQQIPGGPESVVRGGEDEEIVRILSPTHSSAYPLLGEYVHSLAGQTLTLHTFFGHEINPAEVERAASRYTVTINADSSATFRGTYSNEGTVALKEAPPAEFTIPANELLPLIYSGSVPKNNLEGAIRRDLFVGFANGFWGGRYGNDAAGFCTNPLNNSLGPWCEKFNQPGFGDARASLSPYPTCEQYAAVINQFSDSYGNPFSDGAKNTVVGIGAPADKLRLTILPDQGSAMPVNSGNPNCGAAAAGGGGSSAGGSASGGGPRSGAPAPVPGVAVTPRLLAKTELKGDKLRLGRVTCSAACGRVRAVVKKGKKKVLARALVKRGGRSVALVAKPTKTGQTLLADGQKNLRLELWVAPAGQKPTHVVRKLTVDG